MAIQLASGGLPNIASSSFGSWAGLIPKATIDSVDPGRIFETFSNDFLAPNAIGKRVNSFVNSVVPIISDDPVSFYDTSLFGKNPDPLRVLKATNGLVNQINSGQFLTPLPFTASFVLGNNQQPVPGTLGLGAGQPQTPQLVPGPNTGRLAPINALSAFGKNPTAFDGFLGTLAFSTALFDNPIFFTNLQQANQGVVF
jgi:hypothetical protein